MIYIAGPITGKSRTEIRETFFRMEALAQERGICVYNPARLPEGLKWGTYMLMAAAVLLCEDIGAMIMLQGWQESQGAVIEHSIARKKGIPIYYTDPEDAFLYGRKECVGKGGNKSGSNN